MHVVKLGVQTAPLHHARILELDCTVAVPYPVLLFLFLRPTTPSTRGMPDFLAWEEQRRKINESETARISWWPLGRVGHDGGGEDETGGQLQALVYQYYRSS